MLMRCLRFGVCAAFLLVVSTALAQPAPKDQPSPKDLILGQWAMSEKKDGAEIKAAFTFTKDKAVATLSFKMGDNKPDEITIDARYVWVADDTIEMTARPPGAKEDQTEKVKIKVSDKELIMSGKDGKALTFNRPK
jgi:uncharacterized protein (TIGR03066 family)